MFQNLKAQAVFEDTIQPSVPTITSADPASGYTNGTMRFFFSGASSDPTFKEYECSIDSESDWQGCSSGESFTASEGSHTLYVRSIDWSGNLPGTPPAANGPWTRPARIQPWTQQSGLSQAQPWKALMPSSSSHQTSRRKRPSSAT